ncbi:hypothetical protein TNCV_2134641 [Trichonephila clavipes]|nr:hypothetical protein TNCV_2134641 [Trichonephila clavipes]
MVRKKKQASNPRKNIALNTEKNEVFTAERYSVFAEEAIQFTVNGRNILLHLLVNQFKFCKASSEIYVSRRHEDEKQFLKIGL